MDLLESLVDAIVRLEGDAVVMHVGEKPYVVTTSAAMSAHRGPLAWGQVELSSRILTSDMVLGMIGQILPSDLRHSLDIVGAVEHEVALPGDNRRFTVVAARGGEDVWLELKRQQPPAAAHQQTAEPVPVVESTPAPAQADETPASPARVNLPAPQRKSRRTIADDLAGREDKPRQTRASAETHRRKPAAIPADTVAEKIPPPIEILAPVEDAPMATVPEQAQPPAKESTVVVPASVNPVEPTHVESKPAIGIPKMADMVVSSPPTPSRHVDEAAPVSIEAPVADADTDALLASAMSALLTSHDADLPEELSSGLESIDMDEMHVTPGRSDEGEIAVASFQAPAAANSPDRTVMPPIAPITPITDVAVPDAVASTVHEKSPTPSEPVRMSDRRQEVPRPMVVPVARMRSEPLPSAPEPTVDADAMLRILRLAAARGASVVYIVSQSRPMVRVDGDISPLEDEAVLSSADVALFIDSLGAVIDDTATDTVEWLLEVPEVGRVRHLTFHDHRGPGIIFRMTPPRAISAEQLALSADIQALCAQPDGLVIVTGAAMSGKSTLLSAFVDLINRTRGDHVIAIESQIRFVHENLRSFVSQREIRGGSEAFAPAARRALLEDPDVLVIEDIASPDVAAIALDAAASGRLVFGAIEASSSTAAIEQLIESFPAERRTQVRSALAGSLRGIVAQILLRRLKGGRVAAREVLLGSPAVANLILEGKTAQLTAALNGRRHGMVSLTDSLAALVRDGVVHLGEAYRKAADRDALLGVLKGEGIDPSLAERLA